LRNCREGDETRSSRSIDQGVDGIRDTWQFGMYPGDELLTCLGMAGLQTNGKAALLRHSRSTLVSINWNIGHIGQTGMRTMGFHRAAMAALTFMAVSALALDFGHGADTCGASGVVRKAIACARPASEVLDAAPTAQSVSSQLAATDLLASDHQPGDFRHVELVRLETDIAHAQRTPGVRQRPRSDHEVARYTKMITRDRKNDDAYFRRSIANL
jgi:hypothetical protein